MNETLEGKITGVVEMMGIDAVIVVLSTDVVRDGKELETPVSVEPFSEEPKVVDAVPDKVNDEEGNNVRTELVGTCDEVRMETETS